MAETYRFLKQCTVKINIPGEQGTGFFIDQGLILTCKHVVKESPNKKVKITYQGRDNYCVKEIEKHNELDLALIQLEIDEKHPCVELNDSVEPYDQLYAYGFPPSLGTNTSLATAEGINDDETILTFESKTVRPGFSGSPLLNIRTRMVCGIVTQEAKVRLRGNTLQGFGGSAIPLSKIFAEYPNLKRLEKSLSLVKNPYSPQSLINGDSQPNWGGEFQHYCQLVIPVFREGKQTDQKVRFEEPKVYPQAELEVSPSPQPLIEGDQIQKLKQNLALEAEELSISLRDLPRLIERFVGFSLCKYNLQPGQLIVRLYLPKELLRQPVSEWLGQEISLLTKYQIVLGCSDRYDPLMKRKADELYRFLREGWDDLCKIVPEGSKVKLKELKWMSSDDAIQGRYFGDYSSFQCYGDWLQPNAQGNWDTLIQFGMPLALWMCTGKLRRSDVESKFNHLIDRDFYSFLQEIPKVQYNLQNQGQGYLGVLCEDINYTPNLVQPDEDDFFDLF